MAAMVVFSLIVWSLVRNPAVSTVVFVVWKDVAVISPANVPDAFDTVSVTVNAKRPDYQLVTSRSPAAGV